MFLQINMLLSFDTAKVRRLLVPCKKSVVDLHSLYGAGVVLWSLPCPKAFTSPGLDFTSPGVVFTSPGLDFTSPGLVFTNRRVVKPSRGVVHASREFETVNQYFVKTSRRDVRSTFRLLYNMARAYIYIRTICSEKAFTRSPVARFPLNYMGFACEGLRREAFTPPVSNCEHFTPQSFTIETFGNQRFTHIL